MVKIKLFAWFRERAQASEVELKLDGEARVEDVLELLKHEKPELGEAIDEGNYFIAVNHEVAGEGSKVGNSDEVAIFPPVSGG